MINSLIEQMYNVLVVEFLVEEKGGIINLILCDRCAVEGHLLTNKEKSERMDDLYTRLGKQVCLFFLCYRIMYFICAYKTIRKKSQNEILSSIDVD
jgi:hypothetical protein